jgi:hypothetical protein
MISKSGGRFSDQIMLWQSMIPKSGDRFSDQIMLQQKRQGPVSIQPEAIWR